MPSGYHRPTSSGWIFATKACTDNRKNLLNSNISSTCSHNIAKFGPLAAEICWRVWCTQANFNGFRVLASLLQCSDIVHRKPTKLCTMFGRLLVWYTMYTFSGALAPWQNFATCKIHFASKSCVLLYWQRYCMALQQRGQPNFAAWYKEWNYGNFADGATIFGWAAITLAIGPTF